MQPHRISGPPRGIAIRFLPLATKINLCQSASNAATTWTKQQTPQSINASNHLWLALNTSVKESS